MKSRSLFAAATFVSLSAALFFNATARADTTSELLQCNKLNAKQKIVQCCDHVVQQRHRPIWMIDNNLSCGTVVSCVSKKAPATYRKSDGNFMKAKYIIDCKVNVKFKQGDGTAIVFTPSEEPKLKLKDRTDTFTVQADK